VTSPIIATVGAGTTSATANVADSNSILISAGFPALIEIQGTRK